MSPTGNSGGRWLTAALASLLITACAGTQSRHTDPVNDPWEGFNRKMHSFNHTMDRAVARPVAKAYQAVTPKPVQRGLSNFFNNLGYPVTFINQVLQGKFKQSGVSTGRFLVNSTIGLLGFFDPATRMGLPNYNEDFGQTFAKWGYENSRYLVLPVFGPSTLRDGIAMPLNSYFYPPSYVAREDHFYTPYVLNLIQLRAAFLSQGQTLEDAYDPYSLVRDAWLQNRDYRIHDRNPPMTDYEAMLEDEGPD